ncbi:MAG: PEP-CTERM sorting domain-containing protein [Salinisphaera sp.]|uniref:PEP-CTERM sorting domain-containing protein n=1 Tax=Salinisphaera sp. TaxID=1914330 RepID=UPI003C7A6EA9
MKNTITSKSRRARLVARAAVVALSMSVAPMALATSSGGSAPEGAGYLLSYGSNYHQTNGFHDGGIGSYGGRHDVPEPATWGMFGLGLAMIGIGVASRRRRIRASND